MAITRAQQARQMLKEGTKKPAMQGGGPNYLGKQPEVTVPKKWKSSPDHPDTELAYITEPEKKVLIALNMHGGLEDGKPNKGPKGVMSLQGDMGSIGGGGSKSGNNNNNNNDGGSTARERYISDYVSRGAVKGGGEKKKGTVDNNNDGRDDRTGEDIYDEKKITGADVRKARDRYEQQFFDKGKVPPLGSRPTSFKTKLNQRNLQKRLNYINTLQSNLRKKLNTGLIDYQTEFGPFTNVTDFSTLDDYIDEVQSVQDLIDKGFYSDDGRFAKGDIPDFSVKTGIPSADILGEIFGGPITSDKLKDLQGQISDLENLKTSKGLASTTFDDLMKTYQPNRYELLNPPTGGRDDNPILPIIPKVTDDTEEDTTPDRNLGGLSARIGGSLFDFTGMADGGRIGAMDGGMMSPEGGIMDLESGRQMYFLGKLVKKATRAVKKIAKSPIGKAALLYGAGALGASFLGKTQAAGGIGKFLFGQGMKPGFSGPGIPGLFNKLGLTKTAGSLMPTIKGGITLASIIPLLAGKTDEEKDDILKDYYASQKLTPSQSVRGAGSEFDFYNYNLAEGGMPSKEPVAKETMPLLDMDGQEMDLRAEGGFVPIGRMEKADDVPARLSKNEFVFTADAVRNAGDGDVDKGAEVMYNMMKNLESGGDVSQGLEGAREMFQTSKRLEEVL